LQNQSEVFAKNRFTINGLTVVHGRLYSLTWLDRTRAPAILARITY